MSAGPPVDGALYLGRVMHRRLRPRQHRLAYRLASVLVDIDRIATVAAPLRLLSHNRFNLFALHDRDYGDGSATPLRVQVDALLAKAGLAEAAATGRIMLLTMPRLLGFAFNPISLFYCHAPDGALRAVVAEVNNTFGERHHYILPAAGPGAATLRHTCAKAFHVSPFLPMAMRYAFALPAPGAALSLGITAGDGDGPVLTAVHTARRVALTDRALARIFVAYPLMTAKVVAAIGWEALLLWAKRIPVHDHPRRRACPMLAPGADPLAGERGCN